MLQPPREPASRPLSIRTTGTTATQGDKTGETWKMNVTAENCWEQIECLQQDRKELGGPYTYVGYVGSFYSLVAFLSACYPAGDSCSCPALWSCLNVLFSGRWQLYNSVVSG